MSFRRFGKRLINKMRLLSFGSLYLDNVYQVPNHVRGGETLAYDSVTQFEGGKGLNQSIALARAGASVWHAGQIGPDGESLRKLLEEQLLSEGLFRHIERYVKLYFEPGILICEEMPFHYGEPLVGILPNKKDGEIDFLKQFSIKNNSCRDNCHGRNCFLGDQ